MQTDSQNFRITDDSSISTTKINGQIDKKYELTNETIMFNGHKLYRIAAIKWFNDVCCGDLGGFVESENNLSQQGNCWIYGNAKVYENAKVLDDAFVADNSEIYGNAKVYENAKVLDDAVVADNSTVYGSAIICYAAKIKCNAVVCDTATIFDNVIIYGYSQVSGNAKIFNDCVLVDKSKVQDEATLKGKCKLYNNTIVKDKAYLVGTVRTFGNTVIGGNAFLSTEKTPGSAFPEVPDMPINLYDTKIFGDICMSSAYGPINIYGNNVLFGKFTVYGNLYLTDNNYICSDKQFRIYKLIPTFFKDEIYVTYSYQLDKFYIYNGYNTHIGNFSGNAKKLLAYINKEYRNDVNMLNGVNKILEDIKQQY